MKVLFVAAEGVPYAKTGGLADVIGSLPKELVKEGLDVRVIMPKYGDVAEKYTQEMELAYKFNVRLGWRNQYCGILKHEYDGVTFYFVDNELYFKRPGTYGFFDDGERYSYFCRAVLECLPAIGFQPDVIHCHDWHAGMIPVMLTQYRYRDFFKDIKTVFTIHNLQYQGVFSKTLMSDILGIGWEHFHSDGVEFHDQVSFMKGGLNYSDHLTTVSPTYAEEIQHPFFGENLDGVLRKHRNKLSGILNGIDYDVWNPTTDEHIFQTFNARAVRKRLENKKKLQELLGLPVNENIPLIGLVSRLVGQKGLDLVAHVLEEMLAQDVQLVVLGTGDENYENMFKHAAWRNPDKVSANILFDNTLAHRIYAGSDLFLMPSLFEPCGLGQLIALRYGSLPIVRETGGLKDTVQSYNEKTGEGNGFSFANYNAHDMLYTINRALGYYNDKKIWHSIMREAMKRDYSWKQSAAKYKELYQSLTED